jgi:His/Glu/Gln/Arg/opine family amino acid ABC transporter permease subunit
MAPRSLSPRPASAVPFWRDVRVLGVLAQILFAAALLLSLRWLGRNMLQGLNRLGGAQFICADGSSSLRCAFNFMSNPASFDIGETPIDYATTDSYWRALQVGLLNTVKVALVGIVLATLLGTVAGIAVLSNNWLLRGLALAYIDLIRNTPLLVQLFFLYFAVILQLPNVRESLQPGLGIYLNQRGVALPWPVLTGAALPWLAFLLLALVQFQVLAVVLGQREARTGRPQRRWLWAGLAALAVAVAGWFLAVGLSHNQAVLVSRASRVAQARGTLDGLAALVLGRLPVTDLTAEQLAALEPEALREGALRVCVLEGASAEPNLAAQLRARRIPFEMERFDRPDQAGQAYADGECDALAGDRVMLAALLAGLDEPNSHLLAPVAEYPLVLSRPQLEGLNLAGGIRLTPEYAALLFGLVLYTGAFIAEIVRAGILSVPRGQSEAARALGLSEGQRLRLVVLPQALRVIIPPLTNQYLNLTKNSSLAIAVAYADLVAVTNTILNQSGRAIQVVVLVMLVYLMVSLAISALLNWYNRRVALVER